MRSTDLSEKKSKKWESQLENHAQKSSGLLKKKVNLS